MAGNIISSGLNLMNTAYNGAGGIVISGDAVKGGYFVTDTLANIPSWSNITGALCYCTGDSKFYQYAEIITENGKDYAWVEQVASTTTPGFMSAEDKTKLNGIDAGAEANVQADWNEANTTSDAYIKNKPIIPSGAAANKGVDESIGTSSESTNLPTSAAVAAFVEGKGYKTTDTTYTSKNAAEDGTDVSLVTTGEKYVWNNKQDAINTSNKLSATFIDGLGTLASKSSVTKNDFDTSLVTELDNKVTKDNGKVLSTNDFTNAYKTKLDNALTSFEETDPTVSAWAKAPNKPTYNLGEVADTADYVRMTLAERNKLTGLADVATSGSYDDLSNTPGEVTTTTSGLMSAIDKSNLDAIVEVFDSKESNTTIDTIKEVLNAFENAPEGTDIANVLANKSDIDHTHTVSHTPAGTISQPTFTGTEAGHTHPFNGSASHDHTFTGTPAEHNHTFTGTGTLIKATFTGTEQTASVKYTPAGNISTPSITLTAGEDIDCDDITEWLAGSGSLTATISSTDATVANKVVTLGHAHTPPTLSYIPKSVKQVASAALDSAPTFTGTEADVSHTHTPSGTITVTTDTPGAGETANYTPAGGISMETLTPAGTIDSRSVSIVGTTDETNITPTGTISTPIFSGTAATITTVTASDSENN